MRLSGSAAQSFTTRFAVWRTRGVVFVVPALLALTLYTFFTGHIDLRITALLVLVALTIGVTLSVSNILVHRRLQKLLALARHATNGFIDTQLAGDPVRELGLTVTRLTQALETQQNQLATKTASLARLRSMQALGNAINDAMRYTRDRDTVYQTICRLAVEEGGFCFSWFGLYEPTTHALDLNWYAGDAGGSLDRLRTALRRGHLPAIAALATGQIVSCNDIAHNNAFADSHTSALTRELGSCAFLPLKNGDEVTAVLALYHKDANFFSDQEAIELEYLTNQISLCCDYVDKDEELHHLAYYDALTELPNRVLYTDRLDQALVREHYSGRHVAVVMAHIDRFKEFNTVYGYEAGDLVLQEVARRLMQSVRLGDTVARTGSSAFGIVLTDVSQPADAALVARNIAQAFEAPITIEDRDLYITLRLGIAVSPSDGRDAEALLRNASAALHMVEREAGTRYRFYTPELDLRAQERLNIERQLYRALERNEFAVHYQPIVDLKSGNVIGSEALLRWHNPSLGNVAPVNFIPVAEKIGLIVPIGDWVFETAFDQSRRWHDAGLPRHICVNASAIQLRESDFEERTKAILAKTTKHAPGASLTLEITESNFMENAEHATKRLNRLRDQGLKISIDDFGTGYSSLSYLKRLPVDFLKIDLSFIRDVTRNPEDAAIIKAIIVLAHSLDLTVIAEGVETPEQLALLREFGCDAAQGFLFSPALPPEEFEEFCRVGVISAT